MAWTVKPSATTPITRRAEPYLTDEMKAHFTAEILPRYENHRAALLPILNDLQHRYRCIAHQAMVEVAQFLKISPADVLDTVSFYEEYTIEPTGKCVIAVCQSVACEISGQVALLDHLRDRLGIEPHETTDDGRFTLLTMECLGACEGAPCALINDDRHDNLSIDRIDRLIDDLE